VCKYGVAQNAAHLLECPRVGDGGGRTTQQVWGVGNILATRARDKSRNKPRALPVVQNAQTGNSKGMYDREAQNGQL